MEALLLGEDNVEQLSGSTGIPLRTLARWKSLAKAADLRPTAAQRAKSTILKRLDLARSRYLEHLMAPETVAKESGYYATMAFHKLNDAHQLLAGGPTSRIEGTLTDFLRATTNPNESASKVVALPELRVVGQD